MATGKITVQLSASLKWWTKPVVFVLLLVRAPDPAVHWVAKKGIKVNIGEPQLHGQSR